MQYLLLIYAAEEDWQKRSEAENKDIIADYNRFSDDVAKGGHFRAGQRLKPVATATTVRVKDGKTLTTDGPFAEMKEAIGGYLVFEADDLDAAIELASRIPAASMGGAVEVRPIAEW